MITRLRCATCDAEVDIATVFPWRCPRATADDRRHVLHLVEGAETSDGAVSFGDGETNPFVRYGPRLAWWAFAEVNGMSAQRCADLTREVDAAIAAVDGTGFFVTPFARSDALSDALGFGPNGGVWVKDETRSVAGSHKARHLLTILLHLLAAEELGLTSWSSRGQRPALAIASCGNAAIAASTLAAAVDWPIVVHVPPWASEAVTARLLGLGATLEVCPRRDSDPPGDPTMHRFRDAVASGAVPFSVQGPENALCLDGGRTLGWEIVDQVTRGADGVDGGRDALHGLDRMFVQVGGGAFASCLAAAFVDTPLDRTALMAVQAQGCAPLARAWSSVQRLPHGVADAASQWASCMWPWEAEPASLADGILDDETYDWLGVVDGMARSGGEPVVAEESFVVEAARRGPELTGIDASPTGTAGLAGLLAVRDRIGDDERVGIVFSGVRRD